MANFHQHTSAWNALAHDVLQSYAQTTSGPDDHVLRLNDARLIGHWEEVDHLLAVMLCTLLARGRDVAALNQRWGQLSREYHEHFCQDTICRSRRAEQLLRSRP